MIRAIVFGYDIQICNSLYEEFCKQKRIPCRFNEFIPLSSLMSLSERREKIKGTWNDVMDGNIALVSSSNCPEELEREYISIYHYW